MVPRETRWRRPLVVRDRSIGVVAIGDVLAVVAFLSYGLTTHGIDPLQQQRHTVLTLLPFVLSWVCLAPIGGLYRPQTLRSVRRTLVRTATVWIGVSLLGSAIRSTPYLPGGAPSEFLLVISFFGAGFLLPWRLAVTLAEHVRHNHQGRTERTDRT
jgi:hypothetical protein